MTLLVELAGTCFAALGHRSPARDLGAFQRLGVSCGWGYGQKAGGEEGREPHDGVGVADLQSNDRVRIE